MTAAQPSTSLHSHWRPPCSSGCDQRVLSLAQTAGHDINYIAITGALHAIGPRDAPAIPLNLIGDNGGGALYLAMGVLAAIIEARHSGLGQVVDAAIVDGAASLMTSYFGMLASGIWSGTRGENFGDGGAPFYNVYQCADGTWLSVGPLEARFFAELVDRLGLDPNLCRLQNDRSKWPALREALASRIAERTRDHWLAVFASSDACVAPVLQMSEAPAHPHLQARGTFIEVEGIVQPAPAPRFSRTIPSPPSPPREPDADLGRVLRDWLPPETIEEFMANRD